MPERSRKRSKPKSSSATRGGGIACSCVVFMILLALVLVSLVILSLASLDTCPAGTRVIERRSGSDASGSSGHLRAILSARVECTPFECVLPNLLH